MKHTMSLVPTGDTAADGSSVVVGVGSVPATSAERGVEGLVHGRPSRRGMEVK